MTQPSPFSGATPDSPKIDDAPLIVVARVLAERGHYGFVWIDRDLDVTARYGRLVDFVTVGASVTDDLPALVGLERDIAGLTEAESSVLEVPAVAFMSADGDMPRLSLVLIWVQEQESYLCLVIRSGIGSVREMELSREIRRRLIAEAQVIATSRELERANRDLEDYASVISHDLQAPMRALRYQIDDLQSELGENASPQVSQRLVHLRDQSVRMGKMLSALLEYSSIGGKSDALSEVDTRSLVSAIIASIKQAPQRRISVTGDWPILETLEQPLDLVLRNVIDNAMKHHVGDEATLDIHADDQDDHLEISVSDNGPGIAEQDREAIFLPFRTLGRVNSNEVRGLGLAIVKRVLDSVGGHISVSDRRDGNTGAMFRIVWPKSISR